MKMKMVEIRDGFSCIAAIALKTEAGNEKERQFLAREGFDRHHVILSILHRNQAQYDPFRWTDTTMRTAHAYIRDHFDELPEDGAVVDVEYINGDTAQPAASDIWY